MLVFTEKDECPLADRRPAITMGVFDGVHLGHRRIIDNLKAAAREAGSPAMAITFSPHPRLAIGRAAPPGICSLGKRLELLGESGIDAVWVIPFTAAFAKTPARRFAEEFFHLRLHASAVVLGEAASFGQNREGTMHKLAAWATTWNMRVVPVPPLVIDGSNVSSTAIRLAVQAGKLKRAAHLLGRRFSVEGTVVHGQGHGTKLGFPTLNLDPHHELRPPPGVYLTRAVIGDSSYPSITNIGRPPTDPEIAAGLRDFLIETHLLDIHRDLYGKTAEVEFIHKTRDGMHFPDVAGLIEQVASDLAAARVWFRNHSELAEQ